MFELAARRGEIGRARLENGLSILTWEDHTIPNVALNLVYRAGSRNERPGLTGLSHFFEHMMFNGTPTYGPQEFDIVMERAGGRNNAYTSQDVTVYQDWFPSEALKLVFELESDRMQGLSLEPPVVESERGVVLSERKSTVESDNIALMEERLWATAFTTHSYRWPVIGRMEDIAAWTPEDLRGYYRSYYSPGNALLVVAGDFDREELPRLAAESFGRVRGGTPPPPVDLVEPPQSAERRETLARPAHLAAFTSAWHVPAGDDADHYPLRLLETILLSGQSSRLYRRLVDSEQVALSASGGFDLTLDPTLFVVTCELRAGASAVRAEALLYEEIESVAQQGPTAAELEKAKRIRLADHYRSLKTISGRVDQLGTCDLFFGDVDLIFDGPSRFNDVTQADVRRVAARYFVPENRTVVTMIPTEAGQP